MHAFRELYSRSSRKRPAKFLGAFAAMALVATFAAVISAPVSEAHDRSVGTWSISGEPERAAADDRQSVEVGTLFVSRQSGSVTGVSFYKGEGNDGPHVGKLWDAEGELLAKARFENESAQGWQRAEFSGPIKIKKGEQYTVSYRAAQGRYASDLHVFSDGQQLERDGLTAIAGVFNYEDGFPGQTWRGSNYYVGVAFEPAVQAEEPDQPSQPVDPSPAEPEEPATPSGEWPSAENTGVPSGINLTEYTGPCTITVNNTVIENKEIDCDLNIRASGVKITQSKINGTVATDENSTGYSFSISQSDVAVGQREGTGVGAVNFTADRVHVTGGNRSMHCWKDCTITNSYVHGQFKDDSGAAHESGIRMGQGATIRHNTITCDAPNVPPDAGCSAGLTGYGDFGPVQNNVIDNNLFMASTGGYCAYGGSSKQKPFSDRTNNITFTNNVFERGRNDKCGAFGPITSFDATAPGNTWKNNTWADGGSVPAAN